MKPLNAPHCLALAVTTAALATSSYGAITTTTLSGTNSVFNGASGPTWNTQLKNNDLIDNANIGTNGLKTLTSATYLGGTSLNLTSAGLNNGQSTDSADSSTTGTYISATTANPTPYNRNDFTQSGNTAVATFVLNTSVNTFGYDITSLQSFMGLSISGVSAMQANQTYTVAFSYIGSASYTDFSTVNYKPFTDANGFHESYVNIADSIPNTVIASGVDAVRFTFLNPITGTTPDSVASNYTGTVIRELDVLGTASVPEPSAALLGSLGMLALLRRRRA